MKPLYLIAILTSLVSCNANSKNAEAYFPGGKAGWYKFVESHMRYPAEAVLAKIQGTMIVSFTVNPDSTTGDIQVVSGPDQSRMRDEARRTVGLSKWIPATDSAGVRIKSTVKAPLLFRLYN